MKVVPFIPQHLVEMTIQDTPDGVILMDRDKLLVQGHGMMTGPAGTLFTDDGKIVGCGGIKKFWDGVGEAWGVPSIIASQYKKEIYRAAINFLVDHLEFHRVQVTVIDGFAIGEKFARNLGFEFEGVLRKYGQNKQDFKMFSLVR